MSWENGAVRPQQLLISNTAHCHLWGVKCCPCPTLWRLWSDNKNLVLNQTKFDFILVGYKLQKHWTHGSYLDLDPAVAKSYDLKKGRSSSAAGNINTPLRLRSIFKSSMKFLECAIGRSIREDDLVVCIVCTFWIVVFIILSRLSIFVVFTLNVVMFLFNQLILP